MSEFAEYDQNFGPDVDAFPHRWRNFGPLRDGYYPTPMGGGGANEFVYEITGSFVAGTPSTAKVDIYSYDDESTLLDSNADWIGNLAMFDDHTVGSRGICARVGNVYVAQNAPCDVTGSSANAPVSIGPTAPSNTASLWIDTSGL
jgi:hypothetical protein